MAQKWSFIRVADRENGVSRLHGGPMKPLGSSQHYRVKGLKGAPNWSSIMPGKSRCNFCSLSVAGMTTSAVFLLSTLSCHVSGAQLSSNAFSSNPIRLDKDRLG